MAQTQSIQKPDVEEPDSAEHWRYVETEHGAEVEAGTFTIRLHWKGAADAGQIRAIATLIAAAPILRTALEGAGREIHHIGGYHNPSFTSFEDCKRDSCVKIRGFLRRLHK